MEIWQNIIISLLSGGSVAWIILKLFVKDVAGAVIDEKLKETLKNYTTREDMQIERKELLEEVEDKFLTLYAFREFEKRIEKNFDTIDRRLADSSKRFDKIDEGIEHIQDLIIKNLLRGE